MKISTLFQKSGVNTSQPISKAIGEMAITGISESSQTVAPGHVFVAISGFQKDGTAYIQDAIDAGAALIVTDRPLAIKRTGATKNTAFVQVANARKALGALVAAYYGFPSQDKLVIGITGTNGKTTTALFLQHLLEKAGYQVAYFGTVYNEVNGQRYDATLTTPSATEIQKALANSDDDAVIIEASSQGLDQYRMQGVTFDYALFTNMYRDHLDYHESMENYFQAKKMLFDLLKEDGTAVINTYTMWGHRLASELQAAGKQVVTVGQEEGANAHVLDCYDDAAEVDFNGQVVTITAPLAGPYNQENLILATAVVDDLGLDPGNTNQAIADFPGISGRLETYEVSPDETIIVDYAHTPDAIEALLTSLGNTYPGRDIIHIFGFRGQRDNGKFPKMVQASQANADFTILTTDDLNGVTQDKMVANYSQYMTYYGFDNLAIIMDRFEALQTAFEMAKRPTLLVMTGKGHENYRTPCRTGVISDQEAAEAMMQSRVVHFR